MGELLEDRKRVTFCKTVTADFTQTHEAAILSLKLWKKFFQHRVKH